MRVSFYFGLTHLGKRVHPQQEHNHTTRQAQHHRRAIAEVELEVGEKRNGL